MPTSISFAGSNQPNPTPTQAPKGNLRKFAATPAAPSKDSLHFSGGKGTATIDPAVEAPTPEQPSAEESKGNWFTNRCRTIGPAISTAFHGGNWMSWPFKGWKADLLQASAVLVPLSPFLAGSQLVLIPVWMGVGALARTAWALGKGMWNPKNFLEKTAAKEATKNQST